MSRARLSSIHTILRAALPCCAALALLAPARSAVAAPGVIRAVGVLRNLDQQLCMDVDGGAGAAGTLMDLWACDLGADQAWGFDRDGHLVNGAKGLCLVPPTTAAAKDGYLRLGACTGDASQLWDLVPRAGGFEIRNRKTGYCIDVAGGYVGASGKRLQLWSCDVHDDQLWNFDTNTTEAKATIAKVSAANQELWFRLLSSSDPTSNFTAANLVTALAQAVVVPPVFAASASRSVAGGAGLVGGLASGVSPAVFAGPGRSLYAVTGTAGAHQLMQWSLSGDFAAAPTDADGLLEDVGCWDRDFDGRNDPDEDKNQDGVFNSSDCGASAAGASPSYAACWTGDVAGVARGSVRDGKTDYHDCEYACWDANRDHKFDPSSEKALLTDAVASAWQTAYNAWNGEKGSHSFAGCGTTTSVDDDFGTSGTGWVTCGTLPNPCLALPTWNGSDAQGGVKQTCVTKKISSTTTASSCTCIPATFRPAPRPANLCKAGRGAVAGRALGALPAPVPRPTGWSTYTKVFGEAGAMYAVDNLGKLWSFRGAPAPVGVSGAVTGFAPPTEIDSGWGSYPSVFGGVGGVVYAVDASKQLLLSKYDPIAKTWPRKLQVIATGLPSTDAFGGTDGTIYVRSGAQLAVYMDPRRDGTALAAPASWGGDAPALAVVGGVVVSLGDGTVRATQLAADPVAQVPSPPLVDSQVCIPQTSICLKARAGGVISGSGRYYAATGDLSLVTDAGSWDLGGANLAIDLSPTRPYVSGSAQIGPPELGILKGAFTTKSGASATLALGFGGSFTATIGTGDNAIATDPDKFYVYASVNGDITVTVLGADIALSSYLPGGSTLRQGKILFEPTTPVFYADGIIAYGLLGIVSNGMMGWWQEPVLGFSLGPCIPYTLPKPLLTSTITTGAAGFKVVHDAAGSTRTIETCGNLMLGGRGELDIKGVTIGLAGTLNLDLDLDNDGAMVWSAGEDRTDFGFATSLDATAEIFTLPAASVNATIYYQGKISAQTDPTECAGCTGTVGGTWSGATGGNPSQGRLRMAFNSGGQNLFEGTLLAPLGLTASPASAQLDFFVGQVGVAGPQGSTPEYVAMSWETFSILGWTGATMKMTMSRIGASFTGRLNPLFGLGQLTFNGTGNWDNATPAVCGSYTATRPVCATADAALTLAGYTLAQGQVRTDLQNFTLQGGLDLGAIKATLGGVATPADGTFAVTGAVLVGGAWTAPGDTGKVAVSGMASLTVSNHGGSFLMTASATISGCLAGSCISRVQPLGTLAIDSSGRVSIDNPFDTSKKITIALAP